MFSFELELNPFLVLPYGTLNLLANFGDNYRVFSILLFPFSIDIFSFSFLSFPGKAINAIIFHTLAGQEEGRKAT